MKEKTIQEKYESFLEKAGGYAFPYAASHGCNGSYGMTLRDYLAGQALIGVAATTYDSFSEIREQIVKEAYAIADTALRIRQQ